MKDESRRMKIRTGLTKIFASVGAVLLIYGLLAMFWGTGSTTTVFAQSDAFLSRRIDQIENRFFGIESRLSRLETGMRPSIATPPLSTNNDLEIQYLRSQVELLRTRLGEAECGILKLDERTLAAAERTARNKAAVNREPCRQTPSTPVTLSARP